jgi:hypothetical protein
MAQQDTELLIAVIPELRQSVSRPRVAQKELQQHAQADLN